MEKDLEAIVVLEQYWQKLEPDYGDALIKYRWMLEEYRVSLFAQPLGTRIPVSAKRLDKEWDRAAKP